MPDGESEVRAIILFGPPGSGKGTQAKLIRDALSVAHISTGDMLRERMKTEDELGLELRRSLGAGQYACDELVNRMVQERIQDGDCANGFILDGYPRTLSQARTIGQTLEAQGIGRVVIHLRVDYNRIIARLAGRRHCAQCGAVYHLTARPPQQSGRCDACQAELAIRDDDRESVVRRRLDVYDAQTKPLLEYFSGDGSAFYEIDGATAPPPAIAGQICELVRNGRAVGVARS
ncbi:MAG: nucleoside monophosphate kinase [Bryobacterales bacterium]|nr:nucleoside monophosphate kinase [Bryobacterales bacterium]